MEFARRGPTTAAAEEGIIEEGRCLLDPPRGDAMLVIRDALLLQLQQDRLRHEIIVSELAKIERAMALSSTSCHGSDAGDLKWTKMPSFSFGEKFILHRRWPVSFDHWADMDDHHNLKEGARQGGPESKTVKSVMEDRVSECSRPCCNGKEHEENTTVSEQKLQEHNENTQHKESSPFVKWELTGITIPVKNRKSLQKWPCTICHVETHSEHQLEEHCAGRKHRSNVAKLESRNKASSQMAEPAAEPSLLAGQITCSGPIKWSCSTCQANGTSEADLKEHFNSCAHQQNIEQCKEGNNAAKIAESQEAKSQQNNVPRHAEKLPSIFTCSICRANCTSESGLASHLSAKILHEINNMVRKPESQGAKLLPNSSTQHHAELTSHCSICQADCDQQSDMADHLGDQIHPLKIQALHEETKKTESISPRIGKSQPASEWDCSTCEAKCYTETHFEHHCRGKRHQKKIEALQKEGSGKIECPEYEE